MHVERLLAVRIDCGGGPGIGPHRIGADEGAFRMALLFDGECLNACIHGSFSVMSITPIVFRVEEKGRGPARLFLPCRDRAAAGPLCGSWSCSRARSRSPPNRVHAPP